MFAHLPEVNLGGIRPDMTRVQSQESKGSLDMDSKNRGIFKCSYIKQRSHRDPRGGAGHSLASPPRPPATFPWRLGAGTAPGRGHRRAAEGILPETARIRSHCSAGRSVASFAPRPSWFCKSGIHGPMWKVFRLFRLDDSLIWGCHQDLTMDNFFA